MKNYKEMELFAKEIRILTSQMFLHRGDGHIGGAFSIIESLSVLFSNYINQGKVKDYFVLSKGHAGPSYYATLALLGHIPMDQICTLNENGTILPSHPDRHKTPGVDCTTGSLGQGISQAVGIAYGLKIQKKSGMVFCIIGDGEFQEGEVFEALQFASGKKLDNLIVFLDYNKKQVDGLVKDVSCATNFTLFFESLGIHSVTCNGNDIQEVDTAIKQCMNNDDVANVVILDTVKGFGNKFFEKQFNPHHVTFSKEEMHALTESVKEMKKG